MRPAPSSGFLPYWYVLWIVGGLALLGPLVEMALGYHAVGFFFLCGILGLSLFFTLGPVLLAAGLSALLWDWFFIPPRFTYLISRGEDLMMIVAYFLAAACTGLLTARLRGQQRALEARDRRSQLLYQLVLAVEGAGLEEVLGKLARLLSETLGRDFAVFLAGPEGRLEAQGRGDQPFRLAEKELAQANGFLARARERGAAGLQATAEGLYLPLLGSQGPLGLLACRRRGTLKVESEERELLEAAGRQLALSLERELFRQEGREAEALRASEQLHQALLNSISHELRTPLTALLGTAAALQDEALAADPDRRKSLLEDLRGAGERLNRVIDNLLDLARLNSGMLALKKEWQDPGELAAHTAAQLGPALAGHRLVLDLPEGLPLVEVDWRLLQHALSNLLLNAAAYAPAGTAITLSARALPASLEWRVADEGPGLPAEALDKVFDRFYRLPGSPPGGTGLGLYITRSLMRAHGGEASAARLPGGGSLFTLSVPLRAAPTVPAEAAA